MHNSTPSYSLEAEQSVIGALLMISNPKSGSVQTVIGKLTPEDFYAPMHASIYKSIYELADAGNPYDTIIIDEMLSSDTAYTQGGGLASLIDIVENTPGTSNLINYADAVRTKSIERNAVTRLQDAITIMSGNAELATRLSLAEDALADLTAPVDNSVVSAKDSVKAFVDQLEYRFENPGLQGVATGFESLDKRFNGFGSAQLIICAARPGMGKTTVSTNIALSALQAGKHAMFFSLEMNHRELMQRMIASRGGVPIRDLQTGDALSDPHKCSLLTSAAGSIAQTKLSFNDTAAIDIADLRSSARAEHRKSPLDIIFIDYLQLVTDRTAKGNRFEEVSKISRKLKALAKELNIPIFCLSQLSRKVEERQDKRPISSDLRESGQLEQDADIIIMLYREEVYDEDSERKGILEVITTKFRDGQPGTDFLSFEGDINRISELNYMPPPPQTFGSNGRGFDA